MQSTADKYREMLENDAQLKEIGKQFADIFSKWPKSEQVKLKQWLEARKAIRNQPFFAGEKR